MKAPDFGLMQIVSEAIGPASTITPIGRGTEHIAWLAETDAGQAVAVLTLLFRTRMPSPTRLGTGLRPSTT